MLLFDKQYKQLHFFDRILDKFEKISRINESDQY